MTKQFVHERAFLPAPPDDVWAIVAAVGEVASWVPAVESSRAEGEFRYLTHTNGDTSREEIVMIDNESRSCTYRYIDGPFKLIDYVSTIDVAPKESGSVVDWRATFTSADPGQGVETAQMISGIYRDSLAKLASRLAT